MHLLLDTHVALWWLLQPEKIGRRERNLVADLSNEVWVSAASIWEMSIKVSTGKMDLPPDVFVEALPDTHFRVLDINASHAVAAGKLPLIHGDPFDRMLIAQARVEDLRIVTADYTFEKYNCDPIFV